MFIIIVKAPTPFFYDGYTKQTTMDISAISELVMVMEIQGKHICRLRVPTAVPSLLENVSVYGPDEERVQATT